MEQKFFVCFYTKYKGHTLRSTRFVNFYWPLVAQLHKTSGNEYTNILFFEAFAYELQLFPSMVCS